MCIRDSMGTITNIDGEYSLEARRNGGTLVFSAVGYILSLIHIYLCFHVQLISEIEKQS